VRWIERTASCGLLFATLAGAAHAGAPDPRLSQNVADAVAPTPPHFDIVANTADDNTKAAPADSTSADSPTTAAPADATPPQNQAPTPNPVPPQNQPPTPNPTTNPAQTPNPTPAPLSLPPAPANTEGPPASDKLGWLDRTHREVYSAVWHSSMRVDRWFGSDLDAQVYQNGAYGSLAPAILWDQYYHAKELLRFNANFPLPQIDERFHAFIGRVNPEEYITERDEPSGAFARTYGPATEDATIFGLSFHQPQRQGGYFDAGAGVRISLPMDPYVKGSYVFEKGSSDTGLLSLRETLFWENSEGGPGGTSRIDLERIFNLRWLVRWTASGTISQRTLGMRGYTDVLAMRGFANRRAIALEIGMDGQTKAPVPLHDYGIKFAYRQSIGRRWLIMELRTSVDWPKDYTYQHRSAALGVGIGFEMLFGTEEFLARPVTF